MGETGGQRYQFELREKSVINRSFLASGRASCWPEGTRAWEQSLWKECGLPAGSCLVFREKAMHSRPSQPFAETLIRVSWMAGVSFH